VPGETSGDLPKVHIPSIEQEFPDNPPISVSFVPINTHDLARNKLRQMVSAYSPKRLFDFRSVNASQADLVNMSGGIQDMYGVTVHYFYDPPRKLVGA